MRLRYLALLSLIAVFVLAIPAGASGVSDALWEATVQVINSGGNASHIATVFDLDTDSMINGHYIASDFSNVAIQDGAGDDVVFMPALSTTDKWCLMETGISASQKKNYSFYCGGTTAMNGKLCYFPAAGGMTAATDATLNPTGVTFEYEIEGYFDMSGGASRSIVYNYLTPPANGLVIDNSTAGRITFIVYRSGVSQTLFADGISTGWHNLKVTSDGANYIITVDGVELDNDPILLQPVIAGGWGYVLNGSMLALQYLKFTREGVLNQHIIWENAATFTDLSGKGNDCTPAFRTTTSDPNVTAELVNLAPVSLATPTVVAGDDPELPLVTPTVPDQMYSEYDYSKLPGASVINSLLDQADLPYSLFWFPAIFGLAIVLAFVVYWFSRSVLGMALAAECVLVFFSFMGPIPFWGVIPLGIVAFALIIKRENVGGF